jgi:lysophospholipase L1-like esterase
VPDRRVVIVGNSISLPPAHGVEAYPQRVATALGGEWSVAAIIHSGQTVEEMELEILEAMRAAPSAVVLQVGINECAPRPLAPRGRKLLGAVRPTWLRAAIITAIHRWRPQIIRVRPLAQFTPVDRFAASVRRIAAAARRAGSRLLILPITEVTPAAEARTPFTNREVGRYNHALREIAGNGVVWVDTPSLFPAMTPADYCHEPETVHWSAAAHGRVAEFIVEWLRSGR